MPRLGDDDPLQRDHVPRYPSSAYPRPGSLNFSNVIMLVSLAFILRNLFFTDYRSEEINRLEASGKSAEEITKFVPQRASEKRSKLAEKLNEFEQMKSDIATLKREVKELKKYEDNEADREYDELKSIHPKIHEVRRKPVKRTVDVGHIIETETHHSKNVETKGEDVDISRSTTKVADA